MTNPAVEKMAEIIKTEFMKHYPPGSFKSSAQALYDAGYLLYSVDTPEGKQA